MTKGNGNRKFIDKHGLRLCLLCMRTYTGHRAPCRKCWKKATMKPAPPPQQAEPAPPIEDPFKDGFEEVSVGTFNQDMMQLDLLI